MGGGRNKDSSRSATSLLATSIVFAFGGMSCTGIILASGSDPVRPLLILAGCMLPVWFIFWLLRDGPRHRSLKDRCFWLLRRKSREPEIRWESIRRKRRRQDEYGTRKPPTVEEIREFAQTTNNWVPSNDPRKR